MCPEKTGQLIGKFVYPAGLPPTKTGAAFVTKQANRAEKLLRVKRIKSGSTPLIAALDRKFFPRTLYAHFLLPTLYTLKMFNPDLHR